MRSRKLLALLFCLITFPAIAGYMTLLGAGVGSIAPVVSWVSGTDAFPSTLSFSRTSNATMFDSTGYLTYGPNNLVTRSNDFADASWINSGLTVSAGVADPFGGTDATTLTATGPTRGIYKPLSVSSDNALLALWVRRRTGTGAINFWTSGGGVGTAIVPTGTWVQYATVVVPASGAVYAGIIVNVSGDAIDVYAHTVSAVTYETSPRPQDQVITTASAYYGPRIDYDPNTLAVKGLLIEEARTNLVWNSQTWSGWSGSNATKSSTTIGPDNVASSAQTITISAGSAAHFVISSNNASITSGATHTYSAFAKPGTSNYVLLNFYFNAANSYVTAVFDLSSQTNGAASQTAVGSTTGTLVSTKREYIGNGWFRLSVTGSGVAASSAPIFSIVTAATGNTFDTFGTPTYNAAGTETATFFGFQVELGSSATSYIPTAAASVTRAAETVQLTGAALTALQGSAGSFIYEGFGYSTSPVVFAGSGGSQYVFYSGGSNLLQTYNGTTVLAAGSGTIPAAAAWRGATGWSTGSRSIVLSGGTVASDANSHGTFTTVYLGSNQSSYWINSWVKSFAIYNARLPDATLQAKSVVGASYAANDNGLRFANNDNLPIHWRVAL